MPGKQRVLFLCTGNSARSQMAEAILRQIAGDDYIAYSAGTQPRGVDPRTIEVMDEIDFDIKQQKSKDIALFLDQQFDYVITLCDRAKETCPTFPGAAPIHWSFDDPAGTQGDRDIQLRQFRKVRDEITRRIRLWTLATKPHR
jgi:arsenate reductase